MQFVIEAKYMPELPEIETIKRCLENNITGSRITKLTCNRSNLRYVLSPLLDSLVPTSTIKAVRRRAKYLIIDLDNNHSLVIHLAMSGRFTIQSQSYQPIKHDHLLFYLNNKQKLVFNDARRFGMVYIFATATLNNQPILAKLGPEPLLESFSADYLYKLLKNRKASIKNILMNNEFVVGVGNIYVAEALFVAKIHPKTLCCDLSYNEVCELVYAIKNILAKAIIAGGTSLKDFVNADNSLGYFKQELLVYGRSGKECRLCTNLIQRIVQGSRSSFFCPKCQSLS